MNECIQFLVHRAPKPTLHGGSDTTGLSADTVTTILGCIQPFIRYICSAMYRCKSDNELFLWLVV